MSEFINNCVRYNAVWTCTVYICVTYRLIVFKYHRNVEILSHDVEKYSRSSIEVVRCPCVCVCVCLYPRGNWTAIDQKLMKLGVNMCYNESWTWLDFGDIWLSPWQPFSYFGPIRVIMWEIDSPRSKRCETESMSLRQCSGLCFSSTQLNLFCTHVMCLMCLVLLPFGVVFFSFTVVWLLCLRVFWIKSLK